MQDATHHGKAGFDRNWRDEKWNDRRLSEAAQGRAKLESDLSPLQAIKAYPMAIFRSLLVSSCVIMEGYDTILIGNFFAYPTFQRKYGNFVGVTKTNPSGYQLTVSLANISV